jgi:transposase-like protein
MVMLIVLSITMLQNHEDCLALLEQIRWNGKPKCPYCESNKARKLKNERRYQCNECFTSYSVTVSTILHKTHVELHKWFVAINLVLNSAGGITVRQLAKEIGVQKNTACYMIERIRNAVMEDSEIIEGLMKIDKL